jgi:hypothetical protein
MLTPDYSSALTRGKNRLADNCTQPSAAFVTIYTLPYYFDFFISSKAALSSSFNLYFNASGNFID